MGMKPESTFPVDWYRRSIAHVYMHAIVSHHKHFSHSRDQRETRDMLAVDRAGGTHGE